MINYLVLCRGRALASVMTLLVVVCLAMSNQTFAHGTKHADDEPAESLEYEQQPWGIAAAASEVKRTVDVSMSDRMRFEPGALEVQLGETIRFVIRNEGELMHEFVIGTTQNNDEHAELMLKFPGMEHDEPHMAHVAPGEVGEIIWTFNKPGRFDFACLIAGHYQAGMVGNITVSPS